MFTNILVPMDGSPVSGDVAQHALALAHALHARLTAVTVTVPWETYFARQLAVLVPEVVIPKSDYDDRREAFAASVLRNIAAAARIAGVPIKTLHRTHARPHQAIVEVARQEACDLVVMASHCEPGITGALLGSETMKLLSEADIPVLVYRQP